VVKENKKPYIISMIDKKTKERVEKIISETRSFVQDQTEQGVNIVELAQVMLAMSRETLVDAYGPYVADTYISTQISKLQNDENSLTLH
jgi:isochorismate hydrolase